VTRLEDRLRRDLQAEAEHVTPLSVPRLRLEKSTRFRPAPSRITRRRRRRLAVRWAAGAAAALTAAAVALPTLVLTGPPAVTAAYVVKRADSALSAAGPGKIAQMTTASSGGVTAATTTEEWSYGDQWRAVTYSLTGHPRSDEGSSTASFYTAVSYRTQTWAHEPGSAAAPVPDSRGCERVAATLPLLLQPGLPGTGFSASSLPETVATELRSAISCGALIIAVGRQRVDGIEAIKLTSRQDSPIPETIWVSADTYLPVRVVARSADKPGAPWETADINWLPPTAQNLAKLTVPIPAGFRQVPAGLYCAKPRYVC